MKKAALFVLLALMTVSAGKFMEARHTALFNFYFDRCKAHLISTNNYQSLEQAFKCIEDSSVEFRVLGTVLWSEGSYLK